MKTVRCPLTCRIFLKSFPVAKYCSSWVVVIKNFSSTVIGWNMTVNLWLGRNIAVYLLWWESCCSPANGCCGCICFFNENIAAYLWLQKIIHFNWNSTKNLQLVRDWIISYSSSVNAWNAWLYLDREFFQTTLWFNGDLLAKMWLD